MKGKAVALVAVGIAAAGGIVWLVALYWAWLVALLVVAGIAAMDVYGEPGRRAVWRRANGHHLTDNDRAILAARRAVEDIGGAIRRLTAR